jgi:PAS domain S-box-containing protein
LDKQIPKYFADDEVLGAKGTLFAEVAKKGYGQAEKSLVLEDGRCLWLEVSAHRFNLTGADMVLAIVTDKTSNRRTEAALRESEKLYRTLFEAADDRIGLFTVEDQRPLLLNSAFYESLGYTKEEFLDQGREESVHPDDRPRLIRERKLLFKNGFSSHEYRVMHRDGHYLDMSAKIVLIKGGLDEKDLILFIVRDVSDRKIVMNDLKQAKDRAEESDQLKSAFLANMSHEIRTPMNSIIGFSNLLVNPGLDDNTRELYVSRIVRNSESLLTLISDIIDLAKIESGQLSIIHGKLLLSELISDMEQYALDEIARLGKKDIHVIAMVGFPNCAIETDVIRIAQVMKNLVNNAIKFTERGTVEIGCKKGVSEGSLILYVKDTGIGIASEYFDLIFNQFRQIDGSNTRKFGGTGLGLAICKNLVHLMGGTIWVESEEGIGSVFKLELPEKSPSGIVPKEAEPSIQVSSPDFDRKFSIMVVDDESDSLELYQALLISMGHAVSKALTGYDALKMLEQRQKPDLILLDVSMPVLSGTDTLRLIKERYPQLKVVAQSAHALIGDRDRFLKAGFDEYLPKPFSKKQLTGIITKLFND